MNHKGRSRHFTSPEELEEERKNQDKKKYRKKKDDESESESEEEEAKEEGESSDNSGSDESDSDDDGSKKAKGVSGLIDIENPNRAQKKAPKIATMSAAAPTTEKVEKNKASGSEKPELSRREREEIERQRSQAHYQKLHAEGKTEQARADLARLAIIKQHRAEAAARREQEKKGKYFLLLSVYLRRRNYL